MTVRRLVAAVLILLAAAFPAAAATGDPRAAVQRFNDALLAAMRQGQTLGYEGRVRLLEPVIDDTFALAEMARLAVGSAGRNLDPDQMAALTEAFRAWTVANYASQFKKWSGERIEVSPPRPSTGGAVVVPTRLIPPNKPMIQLDYVARPVEGVWKVVDVLVEGSVSQLTVRRSEFVSTLRRQGFDGLLVLLRRRTQLLAEG